MASENIYLQTCLDSFSCKHRIPYFCSLPWTLFKGYWKSAAGVVHDLILVEVDGKCPWKAPICTWHLDEWKQKEGHSGSIWWSRSERHCRRWAGKLLCLPSVFAATPHFSPCHSSSPPVRSPSDIFFWIFNLINFTLFFSSIALSGHLLHHSLLCLLLLWFVNLSLLWRWIATNYSSHWEYNDKGCPWPEQELREILRDPHLPGWTAPQLPDPISKCCLSHSQREQSLEGYHN